MRHSESTLEFDVLFTKPELWPYEFLAAEAARFKGLLPKMNARQKSALRRLKKVMNQKKPVETHA